MYELGVVMNFLILAIMVIAFLGCSSLDKKVEDSNIERGDVSGEDYFGYNPMGSDAGNIEGLSSIPFAKLATELTEENKKILDSNIPFFVKNKGDIESVQIEGHADNELSIEENLALGEKRAKVVLDYLLERGVPKNFVSIISYGKEKPFKIGDPIKNRRVNFVPINKVYNSDCEPNSQTSPQMQWDVSNSDSGNIPGLSSVLFAKRSAELSEEAMELLEANIDFVEEHQDYISLQIEGHSDNELSIEDNLALGEERAKVVMEYLLARGVPEHLLNIISYGKEKPRGLGDAKLNRRVNFVPIPNGPAYDPTIVY